MSVNTKAGAANRPTGKLPGLQLENPTASQTRGPMVLRNNLQ